ncbi:GNAT family N-acetyltransferase [Salinicola lusitanus]|uniref:GNAT family N-acetyltransferase n=1 Tax=Salinicola lusitanus TaxID=1949085 RepID=UPI00130056AE|nr:GNAT family N-acetyltransferase [Salinicola lusitanus]
MSRAGAVVVRRATPADAEAIATIHVDAWRHNYRGWIAETTLAGLDVAARAAAWRSQLEAGAVVYVGTGSNTQADTQAGIDLGPDPDTHLDMHLDAQAGPRADALLGWVSVGPFRQSESARPEVRTLTPGWVELYGFYVAPRAQGQGVGHALWQAALRWCLAQGYREVGLWVIADNAPAIRFYQRCGLRDLELDQNFEIAGQPLVEKLMARPLGPRP